MDLGLGAQKKTCFQITLLLLTVLVVYMFYIFANVGSNDYLKIFQNRVAQKHFDNSKPTVLTLDSSNNADNSNPVPQKGYLVWNPQCRIPDIDPLHKSIRQFIEIKDPVICSSLPPLTKIEGDSLVIIQDVMHQYDPKKKITCCYQEVFTNSSELRPGENPDDFYRLSPCKTFKKSIKLRNEQYLLVKCVSTKGKSKKDVYENMHATIKITPEAKLKIKQLNSTNEQKMNVLIVGFDSVSRLNLIRTMPHTVLFLKSQGWIDLRGYNKMEDNTCPNFLAILTGLSPKQIRNYCFPKNNETFDETPFIWKDYAKNGFITAYAEDEQWIGTFNYHKSGFNKPPTDYYLRHFMLAAENNMKIQRKEGLKYCLGPTSASDHVLQYAVEFATVFKNNQFFALFWMNSFSHNNVNRPSSMDIRILKFFQDLTETGALNNTFIVFLSDHGMRFGPIRETYVGWMEERLPFIYLWVPQWYRDKHPEHYNNLIKNGDKLTSPYDLHLTLQNVLHNTLNMKIDFCPKCMSLFNEVPWNRSCNDVGVTEHWCTCSEFRKIPIDGPITKNMADYIISEINTILTNGKHLVGNNSTCATLKINRLLSVRMKSLESRDNFNDYKIIFETTPGEAMFEASVREKKQFQLLDTISRINFYEIQSKCVNDTFLKKYCYCVNR